MTNKGNIKKLLDSFKEQQQILEDIFKDTEKNIEGLKDEKQKEFLRSSFKKAKSGDLDINKFLESVKNINNAG